MGVKPEAARILPGLHLPVRRHAVDHAGQMAGQFPKEVVGRQTRCRREILSALLTENDPELIGRDRQVGAVVVSRTP